MRRVLDQDEPVALGHVLQRGRLAGMAAVRDGHDRGGLRPIAASAADADSHGSVSETMSAKTGVAPV